MATKDGQRHKVERRDAALEGYTLEGYILNVMRVVTHFLRARATRIAVRIQISLAPRKKWGSRYSHSQVHSDPASPSFHEGQTKRTGKGHCDLVGAPILEGILDRVPMGSTGRPFVDDGVHSP